MLFISRPFVAHAAAPAFWLRPAASSTIVDDSGEVEALTGEIQPQPVVWISADSPRSTSHLARQPARTSPRERLRRPPPGIGGSDNTAARRRRNPRHHGDARRAAAARGPPPSTGISTMSSF